MISWAGTDLACSVTLEGHESHLDGSPTPIAILYRATHVFRRDDGEWKVLLDHADPLAKFFGPQVSHDVARASARDPKDCFHARDGQRGGGTRLG